MVNCKRGYYIRLAEFLRLTWELPLTNESLKTIAELSGYKETGRLDEVSRLCQEFERAWPKAVRCFEYGRSSEGRGMLALIVSQAGALTPEALHERGIPILMIQGGIHPGE